VFTFFLPKILSFVWLFGVTKVCSNLEELLVNPSCAFVVFLLLNSSWTIGSCGYITIYIWCALLFSFIFYTHVCQVCSSSTIVAVFFNFIISVNLFFATTILGSNLNFYPFWSDIFVQKAMELEGLFITHFLCVGLFIDDMLIN
jgi:hypothetical protein